MGICVPPIQPIVLEIPSLKKHLSFPFHCCRVKVNPDAPMLRQNIGDSVDCQISCAFGDTQYVSTYVLKTPCCIETECQQHVTTYVLKTPCCNCIETECQQHVTTYVLKTPCCNCIETECQQQLKRGGSCALPVAQH